MASVLCGRLPNAAVVHSGGPTAVLNASLAGVVHAARGRSGRLLGARSGVQGILASEWIDLFSVDTGYAEPGSVIGSSRRRLAGSDYDRVIEEFAGHDIRVVFFTGGNGSMSAALALSFAARAHGYELQVIGIPKTIDNDLLVTHHTPGYASTANFFVHAARDAGVDNRSLPTPVCVLETLGRNVGWIVAATALARRDPDDAPHLIYFPECRLSLERIAADVEAVYRRLGRVVVAVCEGQLDESGQPFGADVDRGLASNLGHTLGKKISALLGIRARADKPGLIGRSPRLLARERDRRESYECGLAAVEAALSGANEAMVALDAEGGTFLTSLESVAGVERGLPAEFIAPSGSDVTPEFRRYAESLIFAEAES